MFLLDRDTQFVLHNVRRLVDMLITFEHLLANIEISVVVMMREREKGIGISTYTSSSSLVVWSATNWLA
jgi:hypothetical protein